MLDLWAITSIVLALGYGGGWVVARWLKPWILPACLASIGLLTCLACNAVAAMNRPHGSVVLDPAPSDLIQSLMQCGLFGIVLAAASLGWAVTRKAVPALIVSAISVAILFLPLTVIEIQLACRWQGSCI
jgi:hypothetical protein